MDDLSHPGRRPIQIDIGCYVKNLPNRLLVEPTIIGDVASRIERLAYEAGHAIEVGLHLLTPSS